MSSRIHNLKHLYVDKVYSVSNDMRPIFIFDRKVGSSVTKHLVLPSFPLSENIYYPPEEGLERSTNLGIFK